MPYVTEDFRLIAPVGLWRAARSGSAIALYIPASQEARWLPRMCYFLVRVDYTRWAQFPLHLGLPNYSVDGPISSDPRTSGTYIASEGGMCVSAVTQVNRQIVIVKPCDSSKKKRRSLGKLHVTSVDVCGKIFQACDSEPVTYFRSYEDHPPAVVRISNESDCVMQVVIYFGNERHVEGVISQGQDISFHVPSIRKLQVRCIDGGDHPFCRGQYWIKLLK